MIEKLLANIAPHHCYSCDKIGTILCDSCIKNICDESPGLCLVCQKVTQAQFCESCANTLPYRAAWYVGEREGALERIINDYKFLRKISVAHTLAELLDEIIPHLPANVVVTSVPTIAAHQRVRGYDHALLMGRTFARKRNYLYQPILVRNQTSIQRGASLKKRKIQAKHAFKINDRAAVYVDRPHLIIDDVYTTGATLEAAARCLTSAGVKNVLVATVARQMRH